MPYNLIQETAYLAFVGTGSRLAAAAALCRSAGRCLDEGAGLPVADPLLELEFDEGQDLERHEGVDEGLPAVVAVVALRKYIKIEVRYMTSLKYRYENWFKLQATLS